MVAKQENDVSAKWRAPDVDTGIKNLIIDNSQEFIDERLLEDSGALLKFAKSVSVMN